jgi:para-nitrobenzyl esterase
MMLAALLLGASAIGAQAADPIRAGIGIAEVMTDAGLLRGFISDGIVTFKGIQYATAERFMPPKPVAKWEGARLALTDRVTCPIDATPLPDHEREFMSEHVYGVESEDCLRLHVWTPSTEPARKRPVMVWIHGGGFSTGSSIELPQHEGENLSRTGDVVVVSLNHRLNVLGFLDLSAYGLEYAESANVGMQDLVAALRWVHANIAAFGGDPGNVTIFGESGGGGKVTTLMFAPSAKGLFHKAAVQSSTAPRLQSQADTQLIAARVLTELGLSAAEVGQLKTMRYERLIDAANAAIRKINASRPAGALPVAWWPSRDAKFLAQDPESPEIRALAAGVPMLIGSNKFEFMASFDPAIRNASREAITERLRARIGPRTDAYLAEYAKVYPEDSRPDDWVDLDTMFRGWALDTARWKLAAATAPVYMYHFAWRSPVLDGNLKVGHTAEIAFVFNNMDRARHRTGGGMAAQKLSTQMSRAWVQFARTGNPSHKGLPAWPAYTQDGGATMVLDNTSKVVNHHDAKLLKLLATPAR